MGELAGTFNDSPEAQIAKDKDHSVTSPEGKKIDTGVKDCFADGKNNRDGLPVFKVSHNEFYQNMNFGRQRLRFKSGSDTQKFMQGTTYKQPFWIQHDKDGYMRKIK
jgi:hypothetical protein